MLDLVGLLGCENKKKTGKYHFFAKIFGHVKKKQYLCTRF